MSAPASELAETLITATERQEAKQIAARDANAQANDAAAELSAIRTRIGKQLGVGLYIYKGHVLNVCADGSIHVDKATDLANFTLA